MVLSAVSVLLVILETFGYWVLLENWAPGRMEGLGWNGTVIRSEEVEVFRTEDPIGRSGGKVNFFCEGKK